MERNLYIKALVFAIIGLFIGAGVVPCTTSEYIDNGDWNSTDFIPIDILNEYGDKSNVYVDDDFNESTPGWNSTHFDNIQNGIDAISVNGTVYVYSGTYYEHIILKNGVDIQGEGADVTFIDGSNNGSVVIANGIDSSAKLNGFSIVNGYGNIGGGMYNYNSSPNVTNCIFKNNIANPLGGGIYNKYYSNPIVFNCTFENNSAYMAGAIGNYDNSSPTIIDCNFFNNSADLSGGGIFNDVYSSPIITNCVFMSNEYTGGGGGMGNNFYSSPNVTNCTFKNHIGGGNHSCGSGIYNQRSSPNFINCIFSNNLAYDRGGGMYNWENGSPTLTNCVFEYNQANGTGGGGMYNYNSSPNLINCTFKNNTAYDGGGIYTTVNSYNYSPILSNCIFTGNLAYNYGGGMYNIYSYPVLINCVFNKNIAYSFGGGIENYRSSPILTNCVFFNNSATVRGGGLRNYNSSPIVTNCILWNNSYNEINNTEGSTPVVTYCDIQDGYPGEGNINLDPIFIDQYNGDFHIDVSSPCIDSGNNLAPCISETDFDGNLRILDGDDDGNATVDMGVYEYQLLSFDNIYVDDDFNSSTPGWNYTHFDEIQEGIDAVAENGIVYVYIGTYYENVVVNKTINLTGEDRNSTIIDGGFSGDVITIENDSVNVKGFTIQHSGTNWDNTGIDLSSNSSNISNNIIISNDGAGIIIWSSNNNVIYSNIIKYNDYHGIWLPAFSENNSIFDNNITSNNNCGIKFENASNFNLIQSNYILSNGNGGIRIYGPSEQNIIIQNLIKSNNNLGIYFLYSENNTIYYNNFINNTQNAIDEENNIWDNGYPFGGNYWDDYNGNDSNNDGIGDTPYNISGGINQDNYPLIHPYSSITNLNTGEGFQTIQSAIDDSDTLNGHTILVRSGTYYENVIINKSIKLIGENRTDTIIDGQGIGDVFTLNVDGITIDNFNIKASNFSINYFSGIIISSDFNNIINNTISNNYRGIYIQNSINNSISNCTVYNNHRGIFLASCNNTLLSNCIAYNNSNVGISLSSSFNNSIINCISSYNIDPVLLTYGINLFNSAENIISNCTANNNNYGIRLSSSSNNIISFCNASYNTIYGIHLIISSNNNTLTNSFAYNNTNYGISFDDSLFTKIIECTANNNQIGINIASNLSNISNCITSLNSGYGILISISSGNIISNCLSYYNQNIGIHLWFSYDNNIRNCVINNNTNNGIRLYSSSTNTFTGCTLYNNNYNVYSITSSNNNSFYHNNFLNNNNNGYDECYNIWDNGYPSAGNYWKDYLGYDFYYGSSQNIPGSDGIGDTPYNISGDNNRDNYPLMNPYGLITNLDTEEVFSKIQDAIDDPDTVSGHTIYVMSGVYIENITIYKKINLIGEDKDNTIIYGCINVTIDVVVGNIIH